MREEGEILSSYYRLIAQISTALHSHRFISSDYYLLSTVACIVHRSPVYVIWPADCCAFVKLTGCNVSLLTGKKRMLQHLTFHTLFIFIHYLLDDFVPIALEARIRQSERNQNSTAQLSATSPLHTSR